MSIAQKLTELKKARDDIKTSIINKGQNVTSDKLSDFSEYIDRITTGSTGVYEQITVTPQTTEQNITPSAGYDAIDSVKVLSVTSGIDENIKSENIKKDITILGVTGDFSGKTLVKDGAYFFYNDKRESEMENYDFSELEGTCEGMFSCDNDTYYRANDINVLPSTINTSNVTNMKNMFKYAAGNAQTDLSLLDTSNVTNMISMFENASGYGDTIVPDVGSLDFSKLYNASRLFYGKKIEEIPTPKVKKSSGAALIDNAFYGCNKLKTIKLGDFFNGLGNPTNAFYGCTSLTNVDFSDCYITETSAATYGALYSMFMNCSSLEEIDFSTLTSDANPTGLCDIIRGCKKLKKLDMSKISLTAITAQQTYRLRFSYNSNSTLTNLIIKAGEEFGSTSVGNTITFDVANLRGLDTTWFDYFANAIGEKASTRTRTVKIYTNLYNSLTDDQKAVLINKGYTLSHGTS